LKDIPRWRTSDGRRFAPGGRLFECDGCGAVQKLDDALWRAECVAIYSSYENYGLSCGIEQAVRSNSTDGYGPRSELVLRQLTEMISLPARGSLLDYGCGKGPTSAAAAKLLHGWVIDGYDLDSRANEFLRRISGFRHLYTADPSAIPDLYDFIVLMHALEHVPNGREVLSSLGAKLKAHGRIVVQMPDRSANPYDLLVADHILHFDPSTLQHLCTKSGLYTTFLSTDVIAKEITLIASPREGSMFIGASPPRPLRVSDQVDWLMKSVDTCRSAAAQRPFGLFGSSIVATWLTGELSPRPDFYIDEDPGKIGLAMEGAPIIAPKDVPRGATVAFATAPLVATSIQSRLRNLPVTFVLPPDYPTI
jgi:SAM-dependent methyltransferase